MGNKNKPAYPFNSNALLIVFVADRVYYIVVLVDFIAIVSCREVVALHVATISEFEARRAFFVCNEVITEVC